MNRAVIRCIRPLARAGQGSITCSVFFIVSSEWRRPKCIVKRRLTPGAFVRKYGKHAGFFDEKEDYL